MEPQQQQQQQQQQQENKEADSDSDESLPMPERKLRLPQRRKTFSDGTDKPPAYLQAYERFDRANIHRKPLLNAIDVKQQRLKDIQRQLQQAQADLKTSQDRLSEFDATVLQPAKDHLMRLELSFDNLPFTKKYHQLLKYKEEHGGTLKTIPGRAPHDKEFDQLCVWVNHTRQRHKKWLKGDLKVFQPHHFELLDKIGFEWNAQDKWQDHFDTLMKFKEHHGHCMVPQQYADQQLLANWVVFQRQEMNSLKRDGSCTNLTPERIAKLDQVGFVWSVFDLKWNKMYDKLKAFHGQTGHCRVVPPNKQQQHNHHHHHHPQDHDPELVRWVRKQREQYSLYQDPTQRKSRKCKLLPEKIQKLEALGFEWNENETTTAVLEDMMILEEGEGETVAAAAAAAERHVVVVDDEHGDGAAAEEVVHPNDAFHIHGI
jgi:hypothetical protein